ncbi:CapA family protein [Riemerella anatipestifer]|uniref:CapA family protein n=1 Tax=Riemerella anatipestifer TaxID=34085 RepID=UPI0030C0C6B4
MNIIEYKSMRIWKQSLWATIGLLLLGFSIYYILASSKHNKVDLSAKTSTTQVNNNIEPNISPSATVQNQDSLNIIAVGDVMFGSNFPDPSFLPPDGGKELMAEFKPFTKDTDVVFANVEGVFLDSGGTPKGKGNNIFCFRQPTEMAKIYKDYGFNLLSLANNHMADFGQVGIESSQNTLRRLEIAFAGSKAQPYTQLIVNNKKVGFAAFAPHTGSQDMNDLETAISIVKELRKNNDFVIVSFHGGAEGAKHQRVTRKREFFYKQNRGNVYEFAHQMIDAGADVVLGHGPHVIRAVEMYKNKFIAYSLGNFCTYGQFNLKGDNALAPMLRIQLAPNGELVKVKVISGIQTGKGGPTLDSEQRAFHKIKELTELDFPETNLEFSNGFILPKYN